MRVRKTYLDIESYRDIGAYLHDVRVHQKKSLEKISQTLRIRLEYLHAIEKGELSILPGPAYTRGFVISYAEELSLNGQDIWNRYQLARNVEKDVRLFNPSASVQHEMPDTVMYRFALVMLAGAMFVWISQLPGQGNTPSVIDRSVLYAQVETPATQGASPRLPCQPGVAFGGCAANQHYFELYLPNQPVNTILALPTEAL